MKNFNFFTGVVFTVYFLQTININAGELNDDTVLASVNGEDITLGNVVSFQSRLSDQYKSMEDSVLFDGILSNQIKPNDALENQSPKSGEIGRRLTKCSTALWRKNLINLLKKKNPRFEKNVFWMYLPAITK